MAPLWSWYNVITPNQFLFSLTISWVLSSFWWRVGRRTEHWKQFQHSRVRFKRIQNMRIRVMWLTIYQFLDNADLILFQSGIWINNETYYFEPRLEADNPSILLNSPLSCQQLLSSVSLRCHWDYLFTERKKTQKLQYPNHHTVKGKPTATSIQKFPLHQWL